MEGAYSLCLYASPFRSENFLGMQIEINDQKVICDDGLSLTEVLRSQNVQTDYVAVAVDLTIVPKAEWDGFVVRDGSKIIIIKAVQGG